jgi:hypothetical protein
MIRPALILRLRPPMLNLPFIRSLARPTPFVMGPNRRETCEVESGWRGRAHMRKKIRQARITEYPVNPSCI